MPSDVLCVMLCQVLMRRVVLHWEMLRRAMLCQVMMWRDVF